MVELCIELSNLVANQVIELGQFLLDPSRQFVLHRYVLFGRREVVHTYQTIQVGQLVGQSDRETIENANTDPSVTQALSLMNGFIEQKIANNNNTMLMQNILNAEKGKAIEAVFLTMLSRKPTRVETKIWAEDLKDTDAREVVADLIWTLANSNEFIFVK